MDQPIHIVQKTNIKLDAIFSSQLKTYRSKDGVSGYQSTFEEYVASMRDDNSPNDKQCNGRVHASLDKSAVSSLWDEVQGVIEYSNAITTSFLNLFGIEQGNGLSPFVANIATPLDLKDLISEFFKPPKLDKRGRGDESERGSTANNDATNNTLDVLDNNSTDEVNNDGMDEDNNAMAIGNDTATALSPEMIASHVSFINECNIESVSDVDNKDDYDDILQDQDGDKHGCAVSPTKSDDGSPTSSNCIDVFTELINCKNLEAVSGLALNFIQLLELGKLSSGSIHSRSKYMSRNQRWFKAKESGTGGVGVHTATVEGKDNGVEPEQKFVTRNSLVMLQCVHGPQNK